MLPDNNDYNPDVDYKRFLTEDYDWQTQRLDKLESSYKIFWWCVILFVILLIAIIIFN